MDGEMIHFVVKVFVVFEILVVFRSQRFGLRG